MFVTETFKLSDSTVETLRRMKPEFGFNGLGEVLFYRTYSREKPDGHYESWADTVIRVIEGVFSIRKTHYINNRLGWYDSEWQGLSHAMAISMFEMKWLPPGRGLQMMGTAHVKEKGGMALYNCAFTNLKWDTLSNDIYWFMDALMHGVGVGFEPEDSYIKYDETLSSDKFKFLIPDTREGWCESVRVLLEYLQGRGDEPVMDYSNIRPKGAKIRLFGGKASGPEPLRQLHDGIRADFKRYYTEEKMSLLELQTNIANRLGVCVIAGNVRRSAELAMSSVHSEVFKDLKNYQKKPERLPFGFMSNNTVTFYHDDDFLEIGDIADRVIEIGEPGVANLRNFRYGRVGKKDDVIKYNLRPDLATGLNPCGEITLEDKELCNIAETNPVRCRTSKDWYAACKHAAFYCSTVSLLPIHDPQSNAVMMRNRRIGVGIFDYHRWVTEQGQHNVVSWLNKGYDCVRFTNADSNGKAGVPAAIKVTTIKPGGTVPKLAGGVGGFGPPTFNYTLRRFNVAANSDVARVLIAANVPYEPLKYDPSTYSFMFPIYQYGKPAEKVSLLEQAMNLLTLQRHWSDNAVSNTLYFRPKWKLVKVEKDPENFAYWLECFGLPDAGVVDGKHKLVRGDVWGNDYLYVYDYDPTHEEDLIEPTLAHILPHIKSCSLLPHTPAGVYEYTPETEISKEEYEKRYAALGTIDWSSVKAEEGTVEKFCTGDVCEVTK